MSDVTTNYGKIIRRADGSYVINDGMYHVPNNGEYVDLWADVDAYANDSPTMVSVEPGIPLGTVKEAKRAEINAGFDAALTASLTMPSRDTPPSVVELAIAIADFRVDDPTGLTDLQAIHEARRTSLLAAVDAANSVEAVQAITVTYAV